MKGKSVNQDELCYIWFDPVEGTASHNRRHPGNFSIGELHLVRPG